MDNLDILLKKAKAAYREIVAQERKEQEKQAAQEVLNKVASEIEELHQIEKALTPPTFKEAKLKRVR